MDRTRAGRKSWIYGLVEEIKTICSFTPSSSKTGSQIQRHILPAFLKTGKSHTTSIHAPASGGCTQKAIWCALSTNAFQASGTFPRKSFWQSNSERPKQFDIH